MLTENKDEKDLMRVWLALMFIGVVLFPLSIVVPYDKLELIATGLFFLGFSCLGITVNIKEKKKVGKTTSN